MPKLVPLGKLSEQDAIQFIAEFPSVVKGSMSADGLRRVLCDATDDELKKIRQRFAKLETAKVATTTSATSIAPPPACLHRGSQRRTCCGSPEMWICRELKTDCVATQEDASRLRGMVATQEAQDIKVCEVCPHRKDPGIAKADNGSWAETASHDRVAPRVGFLSAAYMHIGGTETFHRSLLPRLKKSVDVAGFVATAFFGGDGSNLRVPYGTGMDAARKLAAHCDIIVVWGIQGIAAILPSDRPKVIAVHHSDWSSDWGNNQVLNQIDMIDEVICVNQDTAAKLSACGKPVHFIPNAIDPNRLTPSGNQIHLRTQFSIPKGSKVVLFGHRLSEEKRPAMAIDIAHHLPQDWTMIIAGEGPELANTQAMASTCGNVRVVGAPDSLADWLSISDCFLSLSTFEGFGLSIGEAMAAGVATVSTPAGIAPGLATTLPTDSTAKEWADAIVSAKAIVTPAEILDRFSVQRMVDSWASVIKGLQ